MKASGCTWMCSKVGRASSANLHSAAPRNAMRISMLSSYSARGCLCPYRAQARGHMQIPDLGCLVQLGVGPDGVVGHDADEVVEGPDGR